MSDQKRPYRMQRRAELEEQTRRRITESASRTARGARAGADLDRRHRRARGGAPLDRVPPLPRTRTRCSRPARRTGARQTRRPPRTPGRRSRTRPRAPRPRSASCMRSTDGPRGCTRAWCATSPSSRSFSAGCATSTATCTGSKTSCWPGGACVGGRRAARALRSATRWHSRRGRSLEPDAGTARRRGRLAHVRARGRCGRRASPPAHGARARPRSQRSGPGPRIGQRDGADSRPLVP